MAKKLSKRHFTLALLTAAALPFSGGAQAADDWPSRPITVVVASAAGSGVDMAAREMAQQLSGILKQPVLVDNKPGGTGMLAGGAVARAKPDGYTLLYSNASFVSVAPAVLKQMSYDPVKDLTPIAQTAAGGILLLVNKDLPVNNLKEMVALVKANPNKYSYGSWGVGSSAQLTMEWLQKEAGLQMTHVPYKSTPQIVNELVSGILEFGWTDPGTPVPMLEAKRIKAIAISGNVRVPRTPDVAPMGEQGYPFDAVGWFGVFGPANLPQPILQRLNTEINKIQKSAAMRKRVESLNLEPPPSISPEEFKAIIAKDVETWASIAKASDISVE